MSRTSRSSGQTELDTMAESRPWTACSSTAGSVGDRTSRSSRASKSNLISPIGEGDLPAMPPDTWKRRSMKRSSYDYKHMSIGLPEKEAEVMMRDVSRHSLKMEPIDSSTFSPLSSPESEESPMPPPSRPYDRFAAPIVSREKSEQHDMHAELHWEINAGNPSNWTKRKKWTHTVIACTTAFVCMLASTILTPTHILAVEREVSNRLAVLPTSLYMLGLAFGPITGEVSARVLGRAPVYLICTPLSAAFTLVAALVSNITGFTICRLFAGVFSSPMLHLGYGTLEDIWTNSYRAWILPVYLSSMLLGSNLGPVVSGYAAERHDIRWTQYAILFGSAACLFLIVCMQETSKRAIIRHKEGSGKRALLSKQDLHAICVKPLLMLGTEPIITAQSLYAAYSFAVLYAMYTALPAVLGEVKAFTIPQQGLAFVSMAIGAMFALFAIIGHEYWHYQPRMQQFKEETATEDERSVYTDRRSSRFLSAKPSKDSLHSTVYAQSSRRNSMFHSLRGLSPMRWKTAQPQDDNYRNAIMALAAATYLAEVDGNAQKQTSAERMLSLLDQHTEFGHFCMALENLKLNYDRLELARVLVEALATNTSPSTNLSMYAWGNNSSANHVEHHRRATIDALEAAARTDSQVHTTAISPSQHRKTWIPPANVPPPEWRLWLAMPASALVAGSLFTLGWTINKNVHWAVPLSALGLHSFGLLIALVSTSQYVLECYNGVEQAIALAVNAVLMFVSASVFAVFATDVLSLGAGSGFSLYASISVVLGLTPILLYIYGPASRRRQKERQCRIRT